jgi:uncharacterized membrane protein YfcA
MQLSIHNSIPISKFIIFLSAIVTFYLNTVKSHRTDLIDFTLVRAIMPLSLAGTIVGVLINTLASETLLFVLLCCLMGLLVLVSIRLAYRKIKEFRGSHTEPTIPGDIVGHVELVDSLDSASSTNNDNMNSSKIPDHEVRNNVWNVRNGVLWALLPFVIGCGIISQTQSIPDGVRWTFFTLSILACVSCAGVLHKLDSSHRQPIIYNFVGLVGGLLSGLLGIGGGLLYAPLMLHKGVDAEIAVAVSSTCVLFISASTSMQYLFTGRVAVLYGLFLSLFGVASAIVATIGSRWVVRVTKRPYVIHVVVASAVTIAAIATVAYTILVFSK